MTRTRGASLFPAAALLVAGALVTPCGAAPLAGLSRNAVAFGRVPQGSPTAVQPLFVSNLGDDALVVTALALGGGDPADFRITAGGTCEPPAVLGPGERCRIDLVALPLWTHTRDISATLTVESNAGAAEIRLGATSDAMLPVPILTSAPDFLDFAVQAVGMASTARPLVIGNAMEVPLALGRPALLGGDATDFSLVDDCPVDQPIAPSRACTVTVTFAPRAAGPRATELVIEFTDGEHNGFGRWSITGSGAE